MRVARSERGFEQLLHEAYASKPSREDRLAQASSIIGNYEDSMDRPGTSALWIGTEFHLNREEVAEFVNYLNRWLETGSFNN